MVLHPGSKLDRYTIEAPLGEGGMGVVFAAYDTRLRRRVALKVLRSDRAGAENPSEGTARLLREARAAARLDHPNAVAIFDVGQADGVTYIAMELVRGRSLREYVGSGVPFEQRIEWLVAVARALAAAHARGLVHRDVKPENVMVREDGVVKVLDFGIARRVAAPVDGPPPSERDASPGTTTTGGNVIGTPFYMSPEQMRGAELDGRTDQFSWGVLAYELLTGRLPWGGSEDPLATVAEMLSSEPVPLAELHLPVSPAVTATVQRALAKRPAARFESMEPIIAALEPYARPTQAMSGLPTVDATRPEYATTVPRSALRRRWLVAAPLAIGGLAALLILPARIERRTPSTPSASGAPSAIPTAITDLPLPASSDPNAVRAYRAGLVAMRESNVDAALASFSRAVQLDPSMAPAHLRLALLSFWTGQLTAGREEYVAASRLRASLTERDRAFLDANEPYMERQPADLAELERRLAALVARYPDDAELLVFRGHLLADTGDFRGSIAAARHASEVDPSCVEAWSLQSWDHAYLGETADADRALDRCEQSAPQSASCVEARARQIALRGDCARFEQLARSVTARAPDAAGGYALVAEALAARGRPREAVLEVLGQRWARTPDEERPARELEDRVHLDLLAGDFASAEQRLNDLEKLVASEPTEGPHAAEAAELLDVYEETGREAEASRLAAAYLRRAEAWTRDPRSDDVTIAADPTPRMMAALVRAGAMRSGELRARRDAWLAAWRARVAPFYARYLWFPAWAGLARTADDARAALAAAADFAPLPTLHQTPLAMLDAGSADLLADRVADALASLGSASSNCMALSFPVTHLRAEELLGEARERAGDRAGACAAYAAVTAAWEHAKPRSVTAERARARATVLRCAQRPP